MTEDLFDLSDKYEAMLQQGVRLSGEDPAFFMRGRVQDLQKQLPAHWKPGRIIDFGCGIGETTRELAARFPEAAVVGVDTAPNALERARRSSTSSRITFGSVDSISGLEPFDLCYVNGVFHHIDPAQWHPALQMLYRATASGGYLALFENNPWNPGARWVMKRIPFDRDATLLSPLSARRLVRQAGFGRIMSTRYLFYFPRWLAYLRFLEPPLAALPFGAQYYILAKK